MSRNLNRLAALFAAIALALACVGCAALNRRDASGSVTLGDYLSSDTFETASLGIQSQGNLPRELTCSVANRLSGSVTKREAIIEAWEDLCGVRIRSDIPTELNIDDADISFSFVWDDNSAITFAFSTSEYYVAADRTLYPTENPELVRDIIDRLEKLVGDEAVEQRESASELPINGDTFVWDADGDGHTEPFHIASAGSALEITREGSTGAQVVRIEGATDVMSLRAMVDDRGRCLELTYAATGASGDPTGRCLLRLSGGGFVSEPLAD